MAQKTITIDIPEGYDDLIFNKDTNKIEFIKTSSKPKSWEEYCEQVKNTICYTYMGDILTRYNRTINSQYNEFDTEEEAKSFTALGKLIQLHKSWIGNWKPNWNDISYKYVIRGYLNGISKNNTIHYHSWLVFPTEELCDEFLSTFKDLIEKVKYFL